jgi:predicted phosphodiesterase
LKTFRLAILSDVHADVHALNDALAQIDRLGCDRIVCCGDVVDYGLFPDETIDLLVRRKIPTVRGNRDRWALEGSSATGGGWDLSKVSRRFLASLPTAWRLEHDGIRVAVHHASPGDDMRGIYPDETGLAEAEGHLAAADADVLIVGHTQHAFELVVGDGKWIVNSAALLRSPAEGATNPPATGTFGILEVSSLTFRVVRAADVVDIAFLRKVL